MNKRGTNKRRFFLWLIFAFSFLAANAQRGHIIRNQGLFYSVEGFYGYGSKLSSDYIYDTNNFSPSSYGLKVTANKFINYHLSWGGGVGVLNYEDPGMITFPVMGNMHAYLHQDSNTPFVYAEGGYGFRFNHKKQDQGFLYEAGIGYRYRIKWQTFVVLKLGYHNYNNKEWRWERRLGPDADPNDPFRWYNLKRQTINFTVGFYYSVRR